MISTSCQSLIIHLSKACCFYLCLFLSFFSQAIEKKVETLDEVTIIGNTELPRVNFDQPWQLPSIEKSADKSPPTDIPGVLVPIEPYRYKQQLHFSQFLDVDVESFKPK
tara:strand:- start:463 stop:789 length:327 start_codon:yes stop_codon:yes gene_type:complete